MNRVKTLAGLLAALPVAFATGCAPAYHSYSGCYVDCKYCVHPPLPYTHYEDCACHSCAVSKYLSIQPARVENGGPETDSGTAGE